MPPSKVDWKNLRDAHDQSAERVPTWIKKLVAKSPSTRDDSYLRLRDSLYAPARWSPAGAAAVPLLAEVVASRKPGAHRALWLLADVLTASHPRFVAGELSPADADHRSRVVTAVVEQRAVWIDALGDDDPRIRSAAALAVAALPRDGADVADALSEQLSRETHTDVQASLLLASAVRAKWVGDGDVPAPGYTKSDSPLVAGVATLALVLSGRAPSTRTLQKGLDELLVVDADIEHFPWCRANIQWLIAQVLLGADVGARDEAVNALSKSVSEHEDLDAATRAAQPLQHVAGFAERWGETEVVAVEDLDGIQRRVAEALAQRDGLRGIGWGMPPAARDRRGWLGMVEPGVMEKTLGGKPLWLEWRQLARDGGGEVVPAAISERLGPVERLAAATALLLDAYRVRELSGAWPQLETMLELLDACGDEALSWARSMADALAPQFAAGHEVECGGALSVPAELSFPVLLPMVRAGEPIAPRHDVLIAWAPTPLAREVLQAIPSERREARIYELLTVFPSLATDYGIEQVMPLLDLVRSERIVDVLAGRLQNKHVRQRLGAKKAKAVLSKLLPASDGSKKRSDKKRKAAKKKKKK